MFIGYSLVVGYLRLMKLVNATTLGHMKDGATEGFARGSGVVKANAKILLVL
jgi:hypothetical protein